MHVVVHVAENDLRGIPFKRYASVLGNLIGEGFSPDGWDVVPGSITCVSVDGRMDGEDVAAVLAMAREITLADVVDAYFE